MFVLEVTGLLGFDGQWYGQLNAQGTIIELQGFLTLGAGDMIGPIDGDHGRVLADEVKTEYVIKTALALIMTTGFDKAFAAINRFS